MQDGLISKAKDKVSKALSTLRPVASFGKGLLQGAATDLRDNLANIGTGIGTATQGLTQMGADKRYQDLMRSNQLARQAAFGQGNKGDLLSQSRKIDQGFSLSRGVASLNQPLAQSMLNVRQSRGMEGSFPGGGGLTTLGRGIAPAARQIALGYGGKAIYNAPKAIGSYFAPAVGGLLGGVSAKLQGQDIAEGVGKGITSGIRTSGLTSRFTDPLIQKVAGASYIAKLSPIMRQVVGRIATGLGNSAEDEILAKMEGIEPGFGDRALSFGLGALISPTANEQVVNMFLKENKITGNKAKQVKEVVLESKPAFKPNPDMPNGVVIDTNPKIVTGEPKEKNIIVTRGGKRVGDNELNALGGVAGFETYQDENGETKYRYNPTKGTIGLAAGVVGGKLRTKGLTPEAANIPSSPQSTKLQLQSSTQQGESPFLPYKPIIQGTGMADTSRAVSSELASATRSMFNESDLQTLNKLKRVSNTKAALEGDIETLRKSNPELTAEALDIVRSVDPTKTDDQALEFVRNLPIKEETTTPRVKEADGIGANVYLAEPKKSFIKLRDARVEKQKAQDSYKEWQSQLFKSNNTVTPDGKLRNQLSLIEKGIKQNTSPGGVSAEKMKDISGFTAYTRDVYRNFKEVYGSNFDKIKKVLLDPFDQAKGDLTKSFQNWSKRINTEVEKDLGILKGSKESAAVQNFGEGKLKREQLVKQFGEAKTEKIIKADAWFRTEYDKLLGEVNETMARIYHNNPEKIIPKRSDYYRHFKEMGSGISGLMNIFDSPANISSSLAGTSEYVKPKSKWLSFAQERLGNRTEEDAVGGFIDYIKAAEFNKNIDPHTAKFRALAEDLAIQTEKDPKLNNFIEYVTDFANDLAGKTNPADRFVQKIIPGGRKTMSVINWINNRVKANVILGNLSSSVAQIFNVPQGIAEAGLQNSTKGLGLTVANIFDEATPIKKSNFITERYGVGAFDKFERSMVGNAKKGAAWITGVLDEVGTKYIWNSQYAKALADKVPNPVKFADDQTRKLVAGRGIGEVPLIQKSKVFQLIAPFQLEVGNLWHVMGDWVGEKKFGKLATFFIASYVFNKGAEAVRGSDVSIDPIQASIDAFNTFSDEENKGVGALKAGGRLAGEVLSNVPLAQSAAAAYPEFGFKVGDKQMPTRKDFFGDGDPTRFGSGLLVTKGLQDPLYKLLPPFGGQQFKRTVEGAQATDKGYSESKTGRIRFPVEKTPVRNLQRALFGEFSTPAAREYFDSNATVLGEKQSETFKNLPREQAVDLYNSIIKSRDAKKKSKVKDQSSEQSLVDQAFAAEDTGRINTRVKPNEYQIEAEKYNLKDSDKEYARVGDIYLYKDDAGSVRQIDPYKVESMPSATIYEKLKKQKSAFAIVDDVVNSKISPEEKKEIYKRLGVSEQEATYYTVAKEDNELKTAYVLDKLETLGGDRKKMFEILIKGRIEVNKQRIVSDGVLTALSEKGLVDKDELKKLKDLDLDKVTGKPVVKITGRGKGARVKSIKFSPIKVKPYTKLGSSRVKSLGLKSYKLKTTQ